MDTFWKIFAFFIATGMMAVLIGGTINDGDVGDVIGPLIGLAAVTMPIWIVWIVHHYKAKNREYSSLNENETRQLEELNALAEQLAERIKTLETILDAESPQWREHDEEKPA